MAFFLRGWSWAQGTGIYVTSATFYISMNYWCDIWLNGKPILDNMHPSEGVGIQTFNCHPEHLCYFTQENTLAIKISDTLDPKRKPKPNDSRIGVAYILRLRFSNGMEKTYTSNEDDQHSSYYRPVPERSMEDPRGWYRDKYYDVNWVKARSTGTFIPGIPPLSDPETGVKISFLSASGVSSEVQYPGERHYFRRQFYLPVDPNPLCLGTPTATPRPTHTPTSTPTIGRTLAPMTQSQWTEIPPTPTSVPTLTYRSIPPTPTMTTPISEPLSPPILKTIPSPSPTKRAKKTMTPFVGALLSPKVKRHIYQKTSTFTPTPIALEPTVTPEMGDTSTKAQTMVFDDSTANIYVQFADGPGIYRLEVIDMKGRHLRNLFEKNVVAQTDAWVDWDGKDDQGRDVPLGVDMILFSKGEKELRKLIVIRKSTTP